jgi:hypothetical protein
LETTAISRLAEAQLVCRATTYGRREEEEEPCKPPKLRWVT